MIDDWRLPQTYLLQMAMVILYLELAICNMINGAEIYLYSKLQVQLPELLLRFSSALCTINFVEYIQQSTWLSANKNETTQR